MRVQIHTFQDYLSVIKKCNTIYNESHIISILLNKLPPSWSSFANGLRHRIDSLDLMGVYITMRIEKAYQTFSKSVDPCKGRVYLTKHSDSPKSSHSFPRDRQSSPKGKPF